MLADVVDFDELEGGRRREGAFASILSYVLKFGTTLTLLITGPLIELTGFDAHKALQDPSDHPGAAHPFRGRAGDGCAPRRRSPCDAIRSPATAMNTIRARLEARRGAV